MIGLIYVLLSRLATKHAEEGCFGSVVLLDNGMLVYLL